MSKELEALEKLFDTLVYSNNKIEAQKYYDTLKQALQRLEAIDNSNPSEALECLEDMAKYRIEYSDYSMPIKDISEYKKIKQALIKSQEQERLLKSGDLSDGYHTFNQLYYQRCILFASLVRLNKDKSWKSFKHSDGKYCFDRNGEWFIVGIDTPIGSYTYHYEKKYWDLFECQELECGKEWDGHTEEDVTRLLSLPNEQEKVLEIIKEKNVNIGLVKVLGSVEQYNQTYVYDNMLNVKWCLIEEEFDLLKRWSI